LKTKIPYVANSEQRRLLWQNTATLQTEQTQDCTAQDISH